MRGAGLPSWIWSSSPTFPTSVEHRAFHRPGMREDDGRNEPVSTPAVSKPGKKLGMCFIGDTTPMVDPLNTSQTIARLYLGLAKTYIQGMALRKIVKMGNPVLAARAAPVDSANMARVVDLIPDMVEAMREAGGVGLAAPQVGESLRVIIFEVPESRVSGDDNDGPFSLQALINPEIEPIGEAIELGWEGCLSIPGLRGEVPRHARIRYSGLDGEGNSVTREASGFHARVVQHEVDHLDGILYLERMTDMRRIGYVDEMAAAAVEAKLAGRTDDG